MTNDARKSFLQGEQLIGHASTIQVRRMSQLGSLGGKIFRW
jgi:hypothetical protein